MEPEDCEAMYRWENDTSLWHLGDTTRPFSREALRAFIEGASLDIYSARQVRMMIVVNSSGKTIGCVDLFSFDPLNRRAGVGVLIYEPCMRQQGYALAALRLVAEYAFGHLDMRQLWADIPVSNTASLRLFQRAGFSGDMLRREWVRRQDGTYEDARFLQYFKRT